MDEAQPGSDPQEAPASPPPGESGTPAPPALTPASPTPASPTPASPTPVPSTPASQDAATRDAVLAEWTATLCEALGLDGSLEDNGIDIDAILALAGVAAHSVVRPAAPLTTFIVGYVVGLAAGSGDALQTAASTAASSTAIAKARARTWAAEHGADGPAPASG